MIKKCTKVAELTQYAVRVTNSQPHLESEVFF